MRDYSRTELNNTIDEWILNEKYRAILKRRLLDGICYEPLAEEFDMSVTQIKRIVYKGQEKVFRHLK
jgi:DNA-directed RNA polymerase specialized sigma24 family protein